MYVTTFYSFKGGVGRTMALVNAAVMLALRGRRVLTVDFDLEAPGLDTFDALRPKKETPGIVDFVSRYLETGKAPDATNYIEECPAIGERSGGLWIMPSGRSESYATNLHQVDWNELYEQNDGYLLFEDLKEQWNQIVVPDYVLIDSRTGHTDTCGICTRHLPDAVVVLFFPNEQNLRGLTEVVDDIRSEADGPRKKQIDLHFVMSNVPDLDDEDRILESKINAFQNRLKFDREPMVVHRYDSLSLLNQVAFAKDRPRSRLAREYKKIVREISARNWNDRDGALEYIRRAGRQWHRKADDSIQKREQMLEKIEKANPNDGEVLFRLAELREADHESEAAASLINQAIEAGYDQPDAHLKRSRFRADNNDIEGAGEDVWRVLNSASVSPPMIREAIQRLVRLQGPDPETISQPRAIRSLSLEDKHWLASTFNRLLEELPIATSLWDQILDTKDLPAFERKAAENALGLSYMGRGKCSDAEKLFRGEVQELGDLHFVDAFNYGMARWGAEGEINSDIFQQVVELDCFDTVMNDDPNCLQCMAVAYWAAGRSSEAVEYLNHAQRDCQHVS